MAKLFGRLQLRCLPTIDEYFEDLLIIFVWTMDKDRKRNAGSLHGPELRAYSADSFLAPVFRTYRVGCASSHGNLSDVGAGGEHLRFRHSGPDTVCL